MLVYYITQAVTISTAAQTLDLRPCTVAGSPAKRDLYVASLQKELRLVRRSLAARYPQTPVDEMLHVLQPQAVLALPGMPPTLGAPVFANAGAKVPPNTLLTQLRTLRAAQPTRQHFRLLLVNAFGTNLGDNLMGLTAFRHVLEVLRQQLPNLSVDVTLGWPKDDRLVRQFRAIEGTVQ